MDCETFWQVVISTPAPIRYAAPAQASVTPVAASSTSGLETFIGLVVLAVIALVGLALFAGFVALCIGVGGYVLELLSPQTPPRPTMDSVIQSARREIDELSDSYVRSASRTLFGG